jgi:hypothetical protein
MRWQSEHDATSLSQPCLGWATWLLRFLLNLSVESDAIETYRDNKGDVDTKDGSGSKRTLEATKTTGILYEAECSQLDLSMVHVQLYHQLVEYLRSPHSPQKQTIVPLLTSLMQRMIHLEQAHQHLQVIPAGQETTTEKAEECRTAECNSLLSETVMRRSLHNLDSLSKSVTATCATRKRRGHLFMPPQVCWLIISCMFHLNVSLNMVSGLAGARFRFVCFSAITSTIDERRRSAHITTPSVAQMLASVATVLEGMFADPDSLHGTVSVTT